MTVTPMLREAGDATAACGLVKRPRGIEVDVVSTFDAFLQQASPLARLVPPLLQEQ